jgi:hypothetical protein
MTQIDQYFGNFNDFVTDKDVLLISDTEGYVSTSLKEKVIAHTKKSEGVVIINGDMSDYTIPGGPPDYTKPERFCFLELVDLANKNPNKVKVTIGNRDLNKLNLWQLVQVQDNTQWWRNGDKVEEVEEIARTIAVSPPDWIVQDLTSFWPYWNQKNEKITSWVGWKSRNEKLSLFDRFNAIFGADPSVGTMSAGNLLCGIATELRLFTDIVMKKPKTDDDNNLLAALVFTVFARILDPELAKNPQWKYDGCLYKLLTEQPLVGYANVNEQIYLFSHGGMHSSFNKDLLGKMNELYNSNKAKTLFTNQTHDIMNTTFQKGGVILTLDDLSNFNNSVKTQIDKFYSQPNQATQHLLLKTLVGLACPIGNNPVFGNDKYQFQSPIMTGFKSILVDENKVYESDNIVNILGHSPIGFGYSFGISKKGQKVICTDFSNTFLKSSKDTADFDGNDLTLHLKFTTGEFYLDGKVVMKEKPIANEFNKMPPDAEVKGVFAEPVALSTIKAQPSFTIVFDGNTSINFDDTNNQKYRGAIYHGTGKIKESTVKVFSFDTNRKKYLNNLVLVDVPSVQSGGHIKKNTRSLKKLTHKKNKNTNKKQKQKSKKNRK